MSYDMKIYTPEVQSFSPSGFEVFTRTFGLPIQLHPRVNLAESAGFFPMKAELEGKTYLTGFELILSAFNFDQEIAAINPKAQRRSSLLRRHVPTERHYLINAATDELIRDYTACLDIQITPRYILEPLSAVIFGAYMCEKHDAVFYDLQEGRVSRSGDGSTEALIEHIRSLLTEIKEMDNIGPPFKSWL